ncbi:MAG TPA: NTP transferase domain-containing protein [Ignavibacteriaceae bacterium]|nr:NTP transferase domain-containing protein [Ignavibacteriaceae bacterium]
MEVKEINHVYELAEKFSSPFNANINETAIILAAGHGKRIKSQRSKMLHKIWEVPTVERVYNACKEGIKELNIIIVVGIKAKDVIELIGKRESNIFAYQEFQNGTGHAVQVALTRIENKISDGIVYVLPGDMGLMDKQTMKFFREEFMKSGSDMMVLTGRFEGNPKDNSYGRIIRVKDKDEKGKSSGLDNGKVIEIMEHKDILSLSEDKPYRVQFNGRIYSFSRKDLIDNPEFNSGVYAFKYSKLVKLVNQLSNENVQNEIYITDLISLFNKNKYTVMAISPVEQYVVMGFNNKSVLKEMEDVARSKVYDKLKDIIDIKDPDDFFIHESVVDEIIEMDKKNVPLDITVGKGVYIGKGVKLNYNLEFKKNAFVTSNVRFGQNVVIWQNVHLSCFDHQEMFIGNNVEILWGDIIKGNIVIGDNCRIESSVNMTGSDEYPLKMGKNVLIKGTSYIFGSIIENDINIEHSVLIKKKVEKLIKRNGEIQKVRFYLPMPEGIDAVENL